MNTKNTSQGDYGTALYYAQVASIKVMGFRVRGSRLTGFRVWGFI